MRAVDRGGGLPAGCGMRGELEDACTQSRGQAGRALAHGQAARAPLVDGTWQVPLHATSTPLEDASALANPSFGEPMRGRMHRAREGAGAGRILEPGFMAGRTELSFLVDGELRESHYVDRNGL